MIKPRALKPGDTIGIIAPSSPVPSEDLALGIKCIEARGYQVAVGEHVHKVASHCDYLAGDDSDRLADLHTMFERRDVAAIMCARGGYGALRLIGSLDWDLIEANPKIFVGYSDITSLHLALSQRTGLVTFHGPMVAAQPKLNEVSTSVLWRLLERADAPGILPAESAGLHTVVDGTATGELAGGCLCLLARACGSRFAPDFAGKIVLIEDVHTGIYSADRDLWQLRNAGAFDDVAGFVIGSLTDWQSHEKDPPVNTPTALWHDFFGPLGKPTIYGFPFGHEPHPFSLPLGVRATLDATHRTLTLLESAVVAPD